MERVWFGTLGFLSECCQHHPILDRRHWACERVRRNLYNWIAWWRWRCVRRGFLKKKPWRFIHDSFFFFGWQNHSLEGWISHCWNKSFKFSVELSLKCITFRMFQLFRNRGVCIVSVKVFIIKRRILILLIEEVIGYYGKYIFPFFSKKYSFTLQRTACLSMMMVRMLSLY